jgi:apolipoprotein N-acyltransferase
MNNQIMSFIWLLIGAALMIVYNGNAASTAAWVAPVFVLRFARSSGTKNFFLLIPVLALSHALMLYGPFSNAAIPPMLRALLGMICGLLVFIPFLMDRLLADDESFASTLVFPSAWVGLEFVFARISPLATFGALGYTQYGNLVLMQLASLTGLWGLSFIITWTASTANWLWQHNFHLNSVKRGMAIYLSLFIAILVYGEFRLRSYPVSTTVRVQASSLSYPVRQAFTEAIKRGKYPALHENLKTLDDFVAATATPGTDIAFWQEYALITGEADEPLIVERARALAEQKGIYLGLPLGVVKFGAKGALLENTVTWLSPQGRILGRHVKVYTAPWETSTAAVKEVATFATSLGTVGSAICFDMDYPWLIRQTAEKNVGLMLVPSYDWRGITPFHSHMAAFRAVENGFSLVRAAGEEGLSLAVDPWGRTLARLDNSHSKDKIMTAAAPLERLRTPYSIAGDVLPWLCLAGIALAITRKIKKLSARG